MTIRERIWNLLRERGPMNVKDVTLRLGLPYFPGANTPCKSASDALYALVRFGCVKASGGKAPFYTATDIAPPGRGYGALVRWQRRPKPKPKAKPEARCELAQIFGYFPRSPASHVANSESALKSSLPVAGLARPSKP